jgi:polysaccharide export outer membrane protein
VVEIQFDIVPEFNQIQGIQPDGFLALRDCAPIAAEGMTLAELQDAVGKAYADTLNDPKITIILKDFDKPYFIATGEVLRPGKYELRADTTVAEGLAIAGGLNGQAKHSQVVLFRHVSADRVESHLIDVKRMLKSRDLEEDIHLKPGDFLFVPQNTISKIRKFMPASNLGMYWNGAQY